jgi:hypothetical protein
MFARGRANARHGGVISGHLCHFEHLIRAIYGAFEDVFDDRRSHLVNLGAWKEFGAILSHLGDKRSKLGEITVHPTGYTLYPIGWEDPLVHPTGFIGRRLRIRPDAMLR